LFFVMEKKLLLSLKNLWIRLLLLVLLHPFLNLLLLFKNQILWFLWRQSDKEDLFPFKGKDAYWVAQMQMLLVGGEIALLNDNLLLRADEY
jgi:hypothetical protein